MLHSIEQFKGGEETIQSIHSIAFNSRRVIMFAPHEMQSGLASSPETLTYLFYLTDKPMRLVLALDALRVFLPRRNVFVLMVSTAV